MTTHAHPIHPPSSKSSFPLFSTAATTKDATVTEERYEFQAEVGRVMDIIINSLYSDKDIFLRELVSNAADACDKKRFLSVVSSSSSEGDDNDTTPPQIKIKANVEQQTIIIEDTGVGMTKEELINNLGRIAQSGTKNFMQALGEGKADVNLIGQFGTYVCVAHRRGRFPFFFPLFLHFSNIFTFMIYTLCTYSSPKPPSLLRVIHTYIL